MKRSHLAIAVAFLISVLMTSAVAQSGAIKANVPFDFTVGKQTFPAGEYKLALQGTVLRVVQLHGHGSAYVLYNFSAYDKDGSSRLVFHRYGKRSFLKEAWITGAGHELVASQREIEYARTEMPSPVVVLASALPNR